MRFRLKFRSVLFFSISALVLLIVAGATLASVLMVQRRAEQNITVEVEQTRHLLDAMFTAKVAQLRREVRIIAEEPRLKAVVATEDVDHDTVLGVATELSQASQAELFIILDPQSQVLADVAAPDVSGESMADIPVVREAMSKGSGTTIFSDEQHTYLVVAKRLSFGATLAGAVLVGTLLDDKYAQALAQTTQSTVVVMRKQKRIASAGTPVQATQPQIEEVGATLARAGGVISTLLADKRFAARSFTPSVLQGSTDLQIVAMRSIDAALAPSRALSQALVVILVFGVLCAMLFAVFMSGAVSRPLEALAHHASLIGAGRFEQVHVGGPREVQSLAGSMNEMVDKLKASQQQAIEQERLVQEMAIARRLQTSILPAAPKLNAMEIATVMKPASEVGGDYFDIITRDDGGWIAVGDVAGHGLPSGVVMMMVQSIVSALSLRNDATPVQLVADLNRVVFENVRRRMAQDEHVTFCAIRYCEDGKLAYAGAHEEMLVVHDDGTSEHLPNPGTWVGAIRDISHATKLTTYQLRRGDVLVMYTDGVIEAMNQKREQFGIERVNDIILAKHREPVEAIRDAIVTEVEAFRAQQTDDLTLLVFRYVG